MFFSISLCDREKKIINTILSYSIIIYAWHAKREWDSGRQSCPPHLKLVNETLCHLQLAVPCEYDSPSFLL